MGKLSGMTHFFLSPHYDDAVYSCGGLIHQLTQQKQSVIIMTIMAGEASLPLPQTPVIRDNHQRWQAGGNPVIIRRQEDQKAAGILGAKTLYNDLPDCIYRSANKQALYPTEESLWQDVHEADSAFSALQALGLHFDGVEILYAPLAVGNHVDHQIVRAWAQHLARQFPQLRLKFYEDYPYTRHQKAIRHALASLDINLKPEEIILTEADMQAKISAMVCYESQITTFWEDETKVDADVRHTFRNNQSGQYVEKLWSSGEYRNRL